MTEPCLSSPAHFEIERKDSTFSDDATWSDFVSALVEGHAADLDLDVILPQQNDDFPSGLSSLHFDEKAIPLLSGEVPNPLEMHSDSDSSSAAAPEIAESIPDPEPIAKMCADRPLRSFTLASKRTGERLSLQTPIKPLPKQSTVTPSSSFSSSSSSSLIHIAPKKIVESPRNATFPTLKEDQSFNTDDSKHPNHIQVSSTGDEIADDEEARKERNRVHAHNSRARKKSLTAELITSVKLLKRENEMLRQQINRKFGGGDAATADRMIEEERIKAVERFIHHLRKPEHRIVKGKDLRFMKRMRRNIKHAKWSPSVNAKNTSVASATSEDIKERPHSASFTIIG
eukprot:CAMPEP_0178797934 /NCGR_PEP_ID=MMETSP0745-20121128/11482_1 /TAXON_ID=913974 /ORGANISM="Nitzschia punctata, Strain CCMP561" /LENGTH=342 /DNA_ID=CAMNT_0020456543 /DNA_START=72 /DNA_END=1100 /DNA_ORIENTATION=-